MAETNTIKYHLMAFPLKEEALRKAEVCRFYMVTTKYILVYDRDVLSGAVEITGAEYELLTHSEKEWLFDCNLTILTEFEKEHRESVERGIRELAKMVATHTEEMGKQDAAE